MKIEHIALWTTNLERIKEFYEKYFGGKSGERYHNENTGFESYFITFDSGARLEIMTSPNLSAKENNDSSAYGYAHIAFSVGSRESVDALTEILKGEGYKVISGPRVTGDGYYESCVMDPDGNRVEITT